MDPRFAKMADEDCEAEYAPNCVPPEFPYSPTVCRWCKPEVRNACPCANPDLHLPEYVGKFAKNCSLLEALGCGPIQRHLFSKSDCPNACTSVEFRANEALHELTFEMLNMSIEEAVLSQMPEQQRMTRKMNEFRFPKRVEANGLDSKLWKASATLDELLADYFVVAIHIYRILYGGSFALPPVFAEDFAGLLEEVPPPGFPTLWDIVALDAARLDVCGNESRVREALLPLGTFSDHFKGSLRTFYKCPLSISNEHCLNLLNHSDIVRRSQQLIASSAYQQSTLELALTLNASPPANPIPIVQYYDGAEENVEQLNATMRQLRKASEHLLEVLEAILREDIWLDEKVRNCVWRKRGLVESLLKGSRAVQWPMLAEAEAGRWDNEWFEEFRAFLEEHGEFRLIAEYLTSNMALLTVRYRGLTSQQIVYRDDYTVWELMSDVGGVLGLYFGLTIVAVYELFVFVALVEREQPANTGQ